MIRGTETIGVHTNLDHSCCQVVGIRDTEIAEFVTVIRMLHIENASQ